MSERQLPTQRPESQVPATPDDPNIIVYWVQELIRQVRLTWRLFMDPRVAWWAKLIPPTAMAYVLFPFDIITDLAPGLGQLDDIAVLLLGTKLFIELCPPDVVREHLQALGAKISDWRAEAPPVIEGEFVVEKEEETEEEET